MWYSIFHILKLFWLFISIFSRFNSSLSPQKEQQAESSPESSSPQQSSSQKATKPRSRSLIRRTSKKSSKHKDKDNQNSGGCNDGDCHVSWGVPNYSSTKVISVFEKVFARDTRFDRKGLCCRKEKKRDYECELQDIWRTHLVRVVRKEFKKRRSFKVAKKRKSAAVF